MLDAAEEWGRPPWELAGGSPVLWYERFKYRRSIQIRNDQKKLEALLGKYR